MSDISDELAARRAARQARDAERRGNRKTGAADDPLAAERAAWQERQRAKKGDNSNNSNSNEIIGEEDQVMRARQMQEDNQTSLKNSIKTAREATQLGAHTVQTLHKQTEQFERMDASLDDANDSLSRSERILRGMKSIGGAIANAFSKKPKPTERTKMKQVDGTFSDNVNNATPTSSASSSTPSNTSAYQNSNSRITPGGATGFDDPTAAPISEADRAIMNEFDQSQGVEDSHLDELGDVLNILKLQATDINSELRKHKDMLDTLENKVDTTNSRLKKNTRTMKDMT